MAITNNQGTTFQGAVLQVYNRDYRAMSDVYTYATFALVWSFEKKAPVEVLVNANFECDTNGGNAIVDALPEVLAAFEAHEQAKEKAAELAREEANRKRMEAEAKRPDKGRMVRVFKGRNLGCHILAQRIAWLAHTPVPETKSKKNNSQSSG